MEWRKQLNKKIYGAVAQLVRAGDSSKGAFIDESHEVNGMNSGKPQAVLDEFNLVRQP